MELRMRRWPSTTPRSYTVLVLFSLYLLLYMCLYLLLYMCLYLCLYPYNLYLCNLSLSQCVLVPLLVLLLVRLALHCTTSRSCTSLYTVHLAVNLVTLWIVSFIRINIDPFNIDFLLIIIFLFVACWCSKCF